MHKLSRQWLRISAGIIIVLSGCSGLQESMRAEICNKDRAYERGINDANNHKPMASHSSQCDPAQQEAIAASYKDGYNAAVANRNARRNNNSSNTGSGGGQRPLINVNLGGTQIVGGGNPTGGSSNEKAFFCRTHAFMAEFKSFGPTELEAREAVIKQCSAKYHRMHCEDVECQEND